jgi:hypothetical protein
MFVDGVAKKLRKQVAMAKDDTMRASIFANE